MPDTTPTTGQGYGTYSTGAAGTGPVHTPVYSQAYGPYGAVVTPPVGTRDYIEDDYITSDYIN